MFCFKSALLPYLSNIFLMKDHLRTVVLITCYALYDKCPLWLVTTGTHDLAILRKVVNTSEAVLKPG